MRNYEKDKKDLNLRLRVVVTFLRIFESTMFSKGSGLKYSREFDSELRMTVDSVLQQMVTYLSDYREAKQKYGLNVKGSEHTSSSGRHVAASTSVPPRSLYKSLKKSAIWALFHKDRMIKAIQKMEEWVGRLQSLLAIAMATVSAMKKSVTSGTFEQSREARDLGMERVAKFQRLTRTASESHQNIRSLHGRIEAISTAPKLGALRICRYTEWLSGGQQLHSLVVMDVKTVESEDDRSQLRSLVAILHGCDLETIAADKNPEEVNGIFLNILPCIGYQWFRNQTAGIVYKLPARYTTDSATTLHHVIDRSNDSGVGANKKYLISLGDRFNLAYQLVATVANLHVCGWVHKSIRSDNIMLLPPSPDRLSTSKFRASLFLLGFEYARRDVLIEPVPSKRQNSPPAHGMKVNEHDLYRHPRRQSKPTTDFTKEHDLYAVGVVLLEIGMWKTVTAVFRNNTELYRSTQQVMKQLAKSELERAMGRKYMNAVLSCLDNDFGVYQDDKSKSKLALAFQRQVVDVMKGGTNL